MIRRILILAVALVAGCSEQPKSVEQPKLVTPPDLSKPKPARDNADPATSKELDEVVLTLLAEQLGVPRSQIDMNRPISSPPMNADDLDLVELIMEIEEHFEVTIQDQELVDISGAPPDKVLTRITPAHLVILTKQAHGRSAKKAR
jgi:acyl carrier protein